MRQGSIDSAKIGDDPALYAVTCKTSKGPNGGQAARSLIARPGGNITGIAIVAGAEIYGKNLELLKAVLPGRARIATLFNTTSSVNALWLKATEEAAGKLGVRLVPTGVRSSAISNRHLR
jgi:ABC-type uncharacterized transport system substrate-binding protein